MRARAAEVLAVRAEAGAFAAVSAMLRTETDARVRSAAVGAMSERVGVPAVDELLRRAAAKDVDAHVREQASRVLARS